jgi:predicted RNA binding protein YcfA (HicA-like mRNA interferase family)
MTWVEVIRLKAAGFVEVRSGKGSHLLLKHPTSGKEVWVAVHTKKTPGAWETASCARRVSNDNALSDRP